MVRFLSLQLLNCIPAWCSPHHRRRMPHINWLYWGKGRFDCADLTYLFCWTEGVRKQPLVQSASAVQARLSGHSGGVTAVFLQKPPIFILKNYPILSLITSPLCTVCRVKHATNTHFYVNPAVSEDANFTAIEGNLYLFPTCVHVLCLSATRRGWSFNHSLNVVTRPPPRARGQAELELCIIF